MTLCIVTVSDLDNVVVVVGGGDLVWRHCIAGPMTYFVLESKAFSWV